MTKTKKMSARFWTKEQCRTTLKQCKEAGFNVKKNEGMTQIYNGDDLIVSWLVGSKNMPNLVRVDLSYFE